MASVNIHVHSDFEGDYQSAIDSIKSLADALETYVSTIYGCQDAHEQARFALMHAAMKTAADVHALTATSIFEPR